MKPGKRISRSRKIASLKASADAGDGRGSAGLVRWHRPVKERIALRLDADVLAWFQRGGRDYQTRINRALRKVMMEERNGTGK